MNDCEKTIRILSSLDIICALISIIGITIAAIYDSIIAFWIAMVSLVICCIVFAILTIYMIWYLTEW